MAGPKCDKCEKEFNSADALSQHENSKHYEGKKTKYLLFAVAGAAVLAVGLLYYFTLPSPSQSNGSTQTELDSFAQCLTEKGVKMYGSYTCSACLAQIKMFGGHDGSFKNVDYVECHPRGPNPQTDLCLRRNIKSTPTWILEQNNEETKRLVGLQTFESLAEFSGCEFKG